MAILVNFLKNKNMRSIKFLIICFAIASCALDPNDDRFSEKKIIIPENEIEWFTQSGLLTSHAIGYITIKSKNNDIDTLCVSHNIAEMNLINQDTIFLGFYGFPILHCERIPIPAEFKGFKIILDTSYVHKYKNQ